MRRRLSIELSALRSMIEVNYRLVKGCLAHKIYDMRYNFRRMMRRRKVRRGSPPRGRKQKYAIFRAVIRADSSICKCQCLTAQ